MAADVLTAVVVVVGVMALINVLVIIRLRQRRKSDEEPADDYSLVNASRMGGGMFGLLGGFMVASPWGGQSELDG
jgi:hypothetical protein